MTFAFSYITLCGMIEDQLVDLSTPGAKPVINIMGDIFDIESDKFIKGGSENNMKIIRHHLKDIESIPVDQYEFIMSIESQLMDNMVDELSNAISDATIKEVIELPKIKMRRIDYEISIDSRRNR